MQGSEPLVATVWVEATPEQVFPFFTDPARLTRWLGHAAALDPVAGGRFAVDIGSRVVRGAYVEVTPPSRVVFTWGDAGSAELPPGSTRVQVDLEPEASGTTVRLTHTGLPPTARADHALGWPGKLAELAGLLVG